MDSASFSRIAADWSLWDRPPPETVPQSVRLPTELRSDIAIVIQAAWSERKRLARNRKFYPIDPGLRRVAVTRTGEDRGKQLECAAFLLLRRRFRDVHYWRGKGEVDFVVDSGQGPVPVQVTWNDVSDRALRGVDEFHAAHPTAGEPVFITAASFAAGVPELPAAEHV